MFVFDPTIKLGDIVQVIAFLGVGLGAYYSIRNKLEIHGIRLDFIDAALEDAKTDLKTSQAQDLHIAQQRKEIDAMGHQIEELRHWRGFSNPSGEYRRDSTPPTLFDHREPR